MASDHPLTDALRAACNQRVTSDLQYAASLIRCTLEGHAPYAMYLMTLGTDWICGSRADECHCPIACYVLHLIETNPKLHDTLRDCRVRVTDCVELEIDGCDLARVPIGDWAHCFIDHMDAGTPGQTITAGQALHELDQVLRALANVP